MSASSSTPLSQFPRLTAEQRSLLLTALTSNKRGSPNGGPLPSNQMFGADQQQQSNVQQQLGGGIDPSVLDSLAPSDNLNGSNKNHPVFGDSFFPPFENGTNFDVDRPEFAGDFVNDYPDVYGDLGDGFGDDAENGEKRKSPEDDDDLEEGDSKRVESEERVSKKPGRKPIMSEPTTKRKAQNRAAQRAFRDRKEKHLKDLEQKVDDYQKAAESATHENGLLKAQVDRLQNELREYRRRLSSGGNIFNQTASRTASNSLQNRASSFGSNGNFGFDFPALSNLPDASIGASAGMNGLHRGSSDGANSNANSPGSIGRVKSGSKSPGDQLNNISRHSSLPNDNKAGINASGNKPSPHTNNPFYPDFANAYGSMGWPSSTTPPAMSDFTNSSGTMRQTSLSNLYSGNTTSNTASPSASTASHNGPSSSCGTSPEPTHQSPPAAKTNDPFTYNGNDPFAAFNNELSPYTNQNNVADITSFDFIANQNGGQFDPLLFGGYRESQDAIVGLGDFSGGLYDDFPPPEFDPTKNTATIDGFSFNLATDKTIPAQIPNKPSLMDQVTAQQNGEYSNGDVKQDVEDEKAYFTCHAVWNRLQNCPKFAAGDFDIDGLCKELSTKAKCSESGDGVSFPKEDVEAALWRLAGKKDAEERLAKEDKGEDCGPCGQTLAQEKERLRQQKMEQMRTQHRQQTSPH